MKFWLKSDSPSIHLDQFFKAMGWGDDYQEIRRHIERGEVLVNESAAINRRTELKEGDTVRYHGQHVIIAGKKMALEEAKARREEGHVVHRRKPIEWTEKPIVKREKDK